jgi:hypothetical protein
MNRDRWSASRKGATYHPGDRVRTRQGGVDNGKIGVVLTMAQGQAGIEDPYTRALLRRSRSWLPVRLENGEVTVFLITCCVEVKTYPVVGHGQLVWNRGRGAGRTCPCRMEVGE